jgi:hypothetical protein
VVKSEHTNNSDFMNAQMKIPFDVTSNVSFLRGATQGNVTSQRERTVPEMATVTHTTHWLTRVTCMAYTPPAPRGRTDHRLPSPTAEPHSHDCYMNTSYSMHNTQSRLPVNDNDVVTSIATIGTFEAVVFFNPIVGF